MRAATLALAAALALAACGGERALPDADLLLAVETDVEQVAPGQGFPVTVRRVWRKDLAPAPFHDAALAPLAVRMEATARREDDVRVEETRRYRAYAFTLDDVTVPALTFLAEARDGGAPRVTRSEPVPVRVRPTLDPQDPGPPEGPGAAPEESGFPWGKVLALVVALLSAVTLYVRAQVEKAGMAWRGGGRAPSTPDALALERLRRIRVRGSGDPEADVVEVGDVVRDYLAARYGLRARRRTTPEILVSLADRRADLAAILGPCDLVKYAAHAPWGPERADVLERAEAYVRATAQEAAP